MKRTLLYALALTLVLSLTDGMAETKKNDFFGFGRKRNQISNALFPGGTETGSGPVPSSEKPEVERDSDTIFRGGKPKKVESAAYIIKDGEKIEKPLPEPREKGSLFSVFNKDSSAETPLMTATNATSEEGKPKPNSILPPIPSRKEKKEKKEEPAGSAPVMATSSAEPSASRTATPVAASSSSGEFPAPSLTAAPMEERVEEKKSGGFFSFFSRDRKKEEPVVTAATPLVEETAAETEEPDAGARMAASSPRTASTAIPETPGYEERAPAAPAAPKPTSDPAPASDQIADVPTFAGGPAPENRKEKKGFAIPNPIEALKPEPKPVSMVGAETIIENGEIVAEQEDIVDSNIVKMGDDKKEPPRIVNGVKTYSSWDDVEGRNVSAADRIISQMRSN